MVLAASLLAVAPVHADALDGILDGPAVGAPPGSLEGPVGKLPSRDDIALTSAGPLTTTGTWELAAQ